MAESSGEKRIPASAYKIGKAREEGNVARSQDLSVAWSLTAALGAFWFLGRGMFDQMQVVTEHYLGNLSRFELDQDGFYVFALDVVSRLAWAVAPFAVTLLIAGLTINLMQVGLLVAPRALAPKTSRLNPILGFKRFLSIRTALELVKSVLKLAVVSAIVYWTVRDRWEEVLVAGYSTPLGAAISVAKLVLLVWFRAVLAIIALALLDFTYQRWQYGQDLMMTVEEAKEEAKQFEGDPRIKQRIRSIQRQMAMKRMMKEVPTADVVITNPVRFAVALRYDAAKMHAPVVVAKGARLLAQRIRQIAEEHNVPVVEKPDLARTLFKSIEVGQPVPEKLFRAVAEVLAFVYKIDRREEKVRERAAAVSA
jgi:flagellar biosynthetic protein FlhB